MDFHQNKRKIFRNICSQLISEHHSSAKVRSNLKGKDRNNGKNSKLLLLIETRPLSPVTRVIEVIYPKPPFKVSSLQESIRFFPK